MNSSLPDFVVKALNHFNTLVDEQEREAEDRLKMETDMIASKSLQLVPFRMLLKSMSDMGLMVRNNAFQNPDAPAQPLRVSEEPSSKMFAPGVSLRLDHPAILEIAIPNQADQERLGVVVINCSRTHPLEMMLKGPFRSIDDACDALASFIAKNTTARKRKPSSPLMGEAIKPDR